MGRNKKNVIKKRKKTSSSGDELNTSKALKRGGSERGQSCDSDISDINGEETTDVINVSTILKETNSVLYDESAVFEETEINDKNVNTYHHKTPMMSSKQISPSKEVSSSPTNADIIAFLKKIENRIENVETKLTTLEKLEKKVEKFDKDVQKMWSHIDKINKRLDEKVLKLEDRMDNAELQDGKHSSLLEQLEKDNEKLKDSLTYLQSQSMRNNLIFCNIPEVPNEKPTDTESILRQFIEEKLKIAKEQVNNMKIETAHRMGSGYQTPHGRARKIVCKFNLFKDREVIRQSSKKLKGSDFYIHEQFHPEVVSKRKSLMPYLKRAREQNKKCVDIV